MASKRIIGALTVKDGGLVKSYGYTAWRPAGDLTTALKNLDRWAADEIVVLDISRRAGLDPAIVRQIAAAKISTPLGYGGGIRSESDVAKLMDIGCDRFVIESLLFEDPAMVQRIADIAGQQAMIGSLPFCATKAGWTLWRPTGGRGLAADDLASVLAYAAAQPLSEYFITSVDSEGRAGTFPLELLRAVAGLPERSVIWFGGLDDERAAHCLCAPVTAAVALGNILHETELALPWLRQGLLAGGEQESLRTVRTFAS